jgi:hypothetical protein
MKREIKGKRLSRRQKRLRREKKRVGQGLVLRRFFARASCGCCEIEMSFENEDRIREVFDKTEVSSSGVIVDDQGVRHEGVDLFYGYSEKRAEMCGKGLNYLASEVAFDFGSF